MAFQLLVKPADGAEKRPGANAGLPLEVSRAGVGVSACRLGGARGLYSRYTSPLRPLARGLTDPGSRYDRGSSCKA